MFKEYSFIHELCLKEFEAKGDLSERFKKDLKEMYAIERLVIIKTKTYKKEIRIKFEGGGTTVIQIVFQ